MSEQESPGDAGLASIGRRDLAPVSRTNPLVSRGIADLAGIHEFPDLPYAMRLEFEKLNPPLKKLAISSFKLGRHRRLMRSLGLRVPPLRPLPSQQPQELPDQTLLTLWIKTAAGVLRVLIPRNTALPAKRTQVLTSAEDNQATIEFELYMGERPVAECNRKIGRCQVTGIAPTRAGATQIEVSFDMDPNGVLSVSAKDVGRNWHLSVHSEW